MGNTQGIEFSTVDEFLDYLPADELEIVLLLRKIILECMPDCKEKLANNVPFYYRHSRICYIWPATIPWEKVSKGVAIGFCKGDSLLDETFETTKFTFNLIKEIDIDFVKQQIQEAILVDEKIVKARRRKIQ
ncbi:DUF1801 domain-containing protein [Flavobacterium degerlachei]|jgi:hypothetical protein|uniref:YdhG-like domain-containing protein n=1 Tax=Flavobacterium degerlachei TaxID=229203 RepID=A0A1H2W502_9FLAO|nr:DUF1801 domain-containing protein [Flavobacterium degerlachei]SDW75611.1 protein of unknown function (DU1801) [Flavobacterium degerlachei]